MKQKYFKSLIDLYVPNIKLLAKCVLVVVLATLYACSKDDGDDDYDYHEPTGGSYSLSTPTGVTAKADGATVYLSWYAVYNATGYNIYHSNSATGTYSFKGYSESNSKTFTQESNGYHYYKIVAVNDSRNLYSDFSAYAYVNINNSSAGGNGDTGGGSNTGGSGDTGGGNTQQKPSAPTGVTVSNEGNAYIPDVRVRWNSVSNATKYYVYKSSSASGTYSKVGETTYNVYVDSNPPTNGSSAYYKVKAVNSAGESGYSDYAYYKSQTNGEAYAPAPVKYGNCTVSGTTMTLRWTVPTGTGIGTPTSAMLRVRHPDTGDYVTLQTLSGSATSVSFTYTPWVDKNGYVYAGIITENAKGTSGGTPKVYDTKNKKWIN